MYKNLSRTWKKDESNVKIFSRILQDFESTWQGVWLGSLRIFIRSSLSSAAYYAWETMRDFQEWDWGGGNIRFIPDKSKRTCYLSQQYLKSMSSSRQIMRIKRPCRKRTSWRRFVNFLWQWALLKVNCFLRSLSTWEMPGIHDFG